MSRYRSLVLASLLACPCLGHQAVALAVEEAVAPAYPAVAVQARVSGSVTVVLQVSQSGAVAAASIAEGKAPLRQASLEAARLWRFRPATGAHEVKLTFSYRLMPKDTPEAQLGAIFRPPYAVEVRKIPPEKVTHYAGGGSAAPCQARRQDAVNHGVEDQPDVRAGHFAVNRLVACNAVVPVHNAIAFGVDGGFRYGVREFVFQ
jgi:TonB family protein